jgi:DsbC/DsbD-like thiol-disulfide interchange protein
MDLKGRKALVPLLLAVAPLYGSLSSAAIAADVSPWQDDLQSSARLIAARANNTSGVRLFRAGVEIKLKEGWKTYWRYPGDSGVPPALDFSKSDNVEWASVRYPAPSRFPDGAGGSSIGYKGDVVWPVYVKPKDASRPALLRLKLAYAVCEKLCVPAEANLELALTGDASSADASVAAAEARIPKEGKIGDDGPLAIRRAHRESVAGKPSVVVDVAAPPDASVTLFAEGPTAQWALPLPTPVSGAPAGLQRFTFELDGLPPGEKSNGATLRLTVVAGEKAVEAAFRLD